MSSLWGGGLGRINGEDEREIEEDSGKEWSTEGGYEPDNKYGRRIGYTESFRPTKATESFLTYIRPKGLNLFDRFNREILALL